MADAGLGQVSRSSGYSVSTSFDGRVLRGVLDAAATGSDPVQKARIFEAAGGALGTIHKDTGFPVVNTDGSEEAQSLQASMRRVIDSDTTGVVRELNVNDRTGGALSTYMKQTLSQEGGADQVGADGGHDGVDVVGTPGLGDVVRAVVVGDDARPVVAGAAGDGVADADAAADPRHQDGAPRQGQGVAAGRADRSGGAAGTAGAAPPRAGARCRSRSPPRSGTRSGTTHC